MNEQLRPSGDLDEVLQEPGRIMIVALLAVVEECDFLYLLRETGLSKEDLSSHLAKLEEPGYVEIEKVKRGKVTQTMLRLTRSGRAAFEQYRKKLNAALAEQLKLASETSKSSRTKSSSS
jgi:DNA-binding MarR family transcriptional regulator